MGNPRYANGQLRRRNRARLRAMGGECGICHGRFGPIHYDEPSDAQHPLSFVVDEIKPVSRWREFGYPSARAAAEDWSNLQPAHWFCNAQKGNKTGQNGPKSGKFLRVRLVRGGEGPPPPPTATPVRPAPIYTRENFKEVFRAMATMKSITARGTRLEQLKQLAKVLASGIDACEDCRALPQLTKQYRETIREIEEIEGAADDTDEISEILAQRESDGKPGAVRTHRTAV